MDVSKFGKKMSLGVTAPMAVFGALAVNSAIKAERLTKTLNGLAGGADEAAKYITSIKDASLGSIPQVEALVEACHLAPQEWQTQVILVNPPSLNVIAAVLLAELHGRMGYFPPVVRLRPVAGSTPTRYEVAEVINLQEVRDKARERR